MIKKAALLVGLVMVTYSVHAGLFDDLKTVVGGHIGDLKSRFQDDQLIDGTITAQATFRENDRGQDTLHHGSEKALF